LQLRHFADDFLMTELGEGGMIRGAVILSMPLSILPEKSVCGLTRPATTIASARAACASQYTLTPLGVVPTSMTSISLTIGAPTAASVMPSSANISR
jgi:hypothetical protein